MKSDPKLLRLVENPELRKALRDMLEKQARTYVETAAQKDARLARVPDQYKKIRAYLAQPSRDEP